jgi:hypothetical protein
MSSTLHGYCKYVENHPVLEFGPEQRYFNHAVGVDIYRASVRKQLTDSLEVVIEKNGLGLNPISEFKLTNQSLTTWDDHWIDPERNLIIDPKILKLNLQRNRLVYVNINTPRPELIELNLEGNKDLVHLYIHETPKLSRLDISGCVSLEYVALGINRNIQELVAKDCRMTESVMEQLLRDFTPTVCASANVRGIGAFRKQHSTVLDLRGNEIVWSNRRIASKIRVLLTNNWVVKWDNNPPYDIVPPQLYGFFVESQIDR